MSHTYPRFKVYAKLVITEKMHLLQTEPDLSYAKKSSSPRSI